MNNNSVINAFICGKAANSSNRNLCSYGNKLVSYYTTIAQRLTNGIVVLNRTKYSVSTSKIQMQLYRTVSGSTIEVTNVPLGATDLTRYIK